MRLAFLILFFASSTSAQTFVLDRTNHLGVRKIDILKYTQGSYFFNGKDLGKKLPSSQTKSWIQFSQGPTNSKSTANCAAGTFVFTISDTAKEKKITGCAQGTSYGSLIADLEVLRQWMQEKQASQ